jgi:probable rRNA maturation factor
VDSPTDVLSFSADFEDPDLENRYLGDVVISLPRAIHQAQARGHNTEQELQLLVVHGVLHLLGYDHLTGDDKNQMWSLQDQILNDLGVSIQMGDEGEQ